MPSDTRALLRQLFDEAVKSAQPASAVPPHLPAPPPKGRILILGAGKASAAMAQATERHYAALGMLDRISGEVATRYGHAVPTIHIGVRESAHPVPDAASVAAAEAALALAQSATPDDLVIVLMSGGASAIWSAPVAGVTLAEKQAVTKALLRSGHRIHEMNGVRKHLSRIKGGRLAAATKATVLTLAISDVPGDDPAVIGSGPTVPDPVTLAQAYAIVATLGDQVPASILKALADPTNETPKPGDAIFARSDYRLVATPRRSLDAAARVAEGLGYRVIDLGDAVEGEAREVGRAHAGQALAAKARGERVALLSGGELTVTMRGKGRGGRSQEYALAVAHALDGAPGIAAIACDTDGIDGGDGSADDPAGAIVLPDTAERARALDLNAAKFLADNDSTGFFARLGDLVVSGPTHTNVNDFRVLLVDP
ncbi:MAG: glycerate kinase [Hyphomicrobiaceae bacterium]